METKDILFSFGQRDELPPVNSGEGVFALRIENALPQKKHLLPRPRRSRVLQGAEVFSKLAYTFSPTNSTVGVYALSNKHFYSLDSNGFSPFYTFDSSTDSRWAVVQWRDTLYFSKHNVLLKSLRFKSVSDVPVISNGTNTYIGAKYMISAHDKLWLGNLSQNSSIVSNRVRWSDTYNPERFEISESTEADYFDLSVDDKDITGLETHRNQVVIFTPNSIWTARYVGLPNVYQFEPLYQGIGCTHHYSAIRVLDKIFFIAADGVYKLDSFQASPIGNQIWYTMQEDLKGVNQAPACVDYSRKLIFWSIGTKTYVYSYDEDRWTVIPEASYASDMLHIFDGNISKPIDYYNTTFPNNTPQIIDVGIDNYNVKGKTFVASGNSVYAFDESPNFVDTYVTKVELPPNLVTSLWTEKDLTSVKLLWKTVGNPAVSLEVNSSDSLNDPGYNAPGVALSEGTLADESIFNLRNTRQGKLLKFTLNITSTNTDYFTNLIGISFRYNDAKASR